MKDIATINNMNYVFSGATGNLTSRTGMLPQTESFAYDNADRQRWKSTLKTNRAVTRTTVYADDYEIITEGGTTKHLYYLGGESGPVAIYVKQSGQTDKVYYAHKDHLGSIVKLTDGTGAEVFRASYDAWGRRTIANNSFKFHRGYTGHEHLDEFRLIDMNGRMYDPLLARFLSPDPFVQAPDFSQNYNRYTYCLNNPLVYTDPSGELWWTVPVIAAALFGTGNTIAHAIRGDINSFWDGMKFFGQGAVAGFALGAAFTFSGPAYLGGMSGFWGSVGNVIHTGMTVYGCGQIGIGAVGIATGFASNGLKGALNGYKSFLGNFYLDENDWFGGILQGFTRHTTEFMQSFIGHGYTQVRNTFGKVDRVDYLGGVTFATNENTKINNGISLGNYVNTNVDHEIIGNFDGYVTKSPLYMHEYGHTIDSRLFGPGYLLAIGIPSIISANSSKPISGTSLSEHDVFWTETRANKRAEKYFKKHYNINWNYPDYPLYK